jgi:hypothetical protein
LKKIKTLYTALISRFKYFRLQNTTGLRAEWQHCKQSKLTDCVDNFKKRAFE